MSKPVIIIDLDDTVVPFATPFIDWYEAKHNHKLGNPQRISYIFDEMFGKPKQGSWQELMDLYTQEAWSNDVEPEPEAVKSLDRLKENFDIHMLTARSMIHRKVTEEYLNKHFPDIFSELHMPTMVGGVAHRTNKGEIASELKAIAFVDDADHNISTLSGYGIKCILYKHPGHFWNGQSVPLDTTILSSWKAIEAELRKLV